MNESTGTATTLGAREHARAQGGGRAEAMVTLPASSWAAVPGGVEAASLIWAETVAGGGYTSKLISRGSTIRLTDVAGDACANLLLFNADQTWERLNVADTVKVLWQAYLGTGQLLLSDQGRVLASIVSDTSGHHDALCGTSSRLRNEERYGDGAPQGPSPAGRDLQSLAVAKHGMSERDVGPGVSFFKSVRVAPDGGLTWTGSAPAGSYVQLRAELPLVVVIANVPHPLDPRPEYTCSTLEVLAWSGPPAAPSDPLRTASPEAERAYLNTDDYLVARGIR